MKRGELVTVVIAGDFGKPRPALVVQSDLFNDSHASVTVLPLTSAMNVAPQCRLTLSPTRQNGLKHVSQIMVDKALTLPRLKVGKTIGLVEDEVLMQVNRALSVWLGIA